MTIEKLKKYGISEETIEAIQSVKEIYNEKYKLLYTMRELNDIEQAYLIVDLIYNSIVYIVRQEKFLEVLDRKQELAFASETQMLAISFLEDAIYCLLVNEDIKIPLKERIPELYDSIYEMINLEDEIQDELLEYFANITDMPSYNEICEKINETIKYVIANAEDFKVDIKDVELYEEFVEERKRSGKYEKYKEEF